MLSPLQQQEHVQCRQLGDQLGLRLSPTNPSAHKGHGDLWHIQVMALGHSRSQRHSWKIPDFPVLWLWVDKSSGVPLFGFLLKDTTLSIFSASVPWIKCLKDPELWECYRKAGLELVRKPVVSVWVWGVQLHRGFHPAQVVWGWCQGGSWIAGRGIFPDNQVVPCWHQLFPWQALNPLHPTTKTRAQPILPVELRLCVHQGISSAVPSCLCQLK